MSSEAARIDTLSKVSFLQGLAREELAPLARCAVLRACRANQVVFAAGECSDARALPPWPEEGVDPPGAALYVVQSGCVEVYIDEEGERLILNTHGVGECFGEVALLDDNSRSATVLTIEPTSLLVIPGASFLSFMDRYPDIARAVTRELTRRIRALTNLVMSLGLKDVYGRVCHVLLASPLIENAPDSVRKRYTHQEIADRVGASREMVSRTLSALTRAGFIQFRGQQLILLRRDLPKRLKDL